MTEEEKNARRLERDRARYHRNKERLANDLANHLNCCVGALCQE